MNLVELDGFRIGTEIWCREQGFIMKYSLKPKLRRNKRLRGNLKQSETYVHLKNAKFHYVIYGVLAYSLSVGLISG